MMHLCNVSVLRLTTDRSGGANPSPDEQQRSRRDDREITKWIIIVGMLQDGLMESTSTRDTSTNKGYNTKIEVEVMVG